MSYCYNKIIEYGLYLLVFFLPLQTRWIIKAGEINGGYSEYLTVSLYGTDILLFILIFLFAIYKLRARMIINAADTSLRGISAGAEAEKSQIQNYHRFGGIPPTINIIKWRDKSQTNPKYWIVIFGLAAASFISILFAQDKLLAYYKFGVLLLGIGLFWLITGAAYDKMKLIGWFLAGISAQAVLGIWQFLTQSGFASKWLGIALHDAAIPGVSVVEAANGGRWLRAYAGLDHPNVLGGLLAIGLLIVVGLIIKNTEAYLQDTRYKIQGHKQIQNSKSNIPNSLVIGYLNLKFVWNLYLVSCALVFTSALFFTFSRAAWVGLIVGAAVMAIGLLVNKNFSALKKLFKLFAVGGVLLVILSGIFSDLVFARVSGGARLEAKSNNERVESIKSGLGVVKSNWLFGVGIGNYINGERKTESAEYPSGCLTACETVKHPSWYYQPVHNVFLLVWVEAGIIGFLFFIALLLYILCYVLWVKNKFKTGDIIINASLISALAAMFMVDHWWWSLHFGIFLFWLILGFALAFDNGRGKISKVV